jgi:hypothetical protein
MCEGENGDLVVLRKENDIIWKAAEDEAADTSFAKGTRHLHSYCGACLEQIKARIKSTLETPPKSGPFAFIPCDGCIRFVGCCRVDMNVKHQRLSEIPLKAIRQFVTTNCACDSLSHAIQAQ